MEILYSDDRVVVCVKPAGILATDEPGGMPELIRRELGDAQGVIKSVHRLDRVVGGVMVYARTRRAASELSAQIEEGRFQKGYLAVVHGAPSEQRGTLEDMLLRDTAERKTHIVPADTPGARRAVLDYERLSSADGLSLLSIRLRTGRTHQIRCQLSGHGLPIAGDVKYGADADGYDIALWSNRIEFFHPRTGGRMSFLHEPPHIYPWNAFLP